MIHTRHAIIVCLLNPLLIINITAAMHAIHPVIPVIFFISDIYILHLLYLCIIKCLVVCV